MNKKENVKSTSESFAELLKDLSADFTKASSLSGSTNTGKASNELFSNPFKNISIEEMIIKRKEHPGKKFELDEEHAIIGYKGFNFINDKLDCLNHKFVPGVVYCHSGDVKICNEGFHFCPTLKQTFSYYSPKESSGHFELLANNKVYYKIKAWGQIDIELDSKGDINKFASQYIQLQEIVPVKDIQNIFLKDIFEKIDKLIEINPQTIISGSLALILQDAIDFRIPKDIDITLPYFDNYGSDFRSSFGDSGEECHKIGLSFCSFDLFVNPNATYNVVKYNGKSYKVADPKEIFNAKWRYYQKGKIKHGIDVIDFIERRMGKNNRKYNNLAEQPNEMADFINDGDIDF